MDKSAVILFNMGGPDSLSAIEPFLFNLFRDNDIFKIPFGQKFFAKLISRRRAPKVRENYQSIGQSSPINYWTECQREMLEKELKKELESIRVFTAMRYWKPEIKDVVKPVAAENFDKIVLLPLYPHYSITTTGSSFNEWKKRYKGNFSKLIHVKDYCDNSTYISAINERIDETILKFPKDVQDKIQLVFSAHGTPISLVKKGDPYNEQIKTTVASVMEARNFSHDHHLCYQSRVGPVKWLQPFTPDTIKSLAKQNKKHLLIIPISFVSDHVETLYELGVEYRKIANQLNIDNFEVMKGLNDSKKFIVSLKEIAINSL